MPKILIITLRHIEKKQEKISDSEHSLRLSHPCKHKPISSGANCADSHAFVPERDSIARACTSESERDTLRIGKIEGLGRRLKLSQILKPSHARDNPRIYQLCKKSMGGLLKPSHALDIPRIYQPCKRLWEVVSDCLRFSNRLTPAITRVSANPAKRVWEVVSNCLRFSNRLTPTITRVSTNPAKRVWEVVSNCLKVPNRLMPPISRPIAEAAPSPNAV